MPAAEEAALLAADEAALAALVAALVAADAALEALDATSLVASLVWEQLTANVAATARQMAVAVARAV